MKNSRTNLLLLSLVMVICLLSALTRSSTAAANLSTTVPQYECQRLEQEVNNLKQQNSQLQNQVSQLQGELYQIKNDFQSLNQANQTQRYELEDLQNKLNKYGWSAQDDQRKLADYEKEVMTLKGASQQVAAAIDYVNKILPNTRKAVHVGLEFALKKLKDARLSLALGDLDQAMTEIRPVIDELAAAARQGEKTAYFQQALVESLGRQVERSVNSVEAAVGNNAKVNNAKILLRQAARAANSRDLANALNDYQSAFQNIFSIKI